MSPGSPETWDRDLPPGEDELWEAVAGPSLRKALDLILARRAFARAQPDRGRGEVAKFWEEGGLLC